MDAVMKEVKMWMGSMGESDLVLCGKLEEDLKVMVVFFFFEVCRR